MSIIKRVRDAITGKFTTKADAKARPSETVTETVAKPDSAAWIAANSTAERIPGAINTAALGAERTVRNYIDGLRSGTVLVDQFYRDLYNGLVKEGRREAYDAIYDERMSDPDMLKVLNQALYSAGVHQGDMNRRNQVAHFVRGRLARAGYVITKETK